MNTDGTYFFNEGRVCESESSNMETYATKVEVSTGLDDAIASEEPEICWMAGGYVSKESFVAEAAYAHQKQQ